MKRPMIERGSGSGGEHAPEGCGLKGRGVSRALLLAVACAQVAPVPAAMAQVGGGVRPPATTGQTNVVTIQSPSAASPPPATAAGQRGGTFGAPVVPPGQAGGQAGGQATTRPAPRMVSTTQGGGIQMNFRDASIDTVLDQLSEAAGFIVVRESPVSGRVTLESKQPVSREEAVSLLNTVLKTNGLAAVQMGRTLKIMARDKAKTSDIPVHTGSDPDQIAETDELITQVVPIHSIDAAQLKNDLQPLVGDASVTANANSNSIIITDTSANIKRIVKIIASLDLHQADAATVKVFQLKYASATSTAKLIGDVFGQNAQSGGGGQSSGGNPFFSRFRGFGGFSGFGGSRSRGEGGGGEGGGGGSSGNRQVMKVTASADDRTNTVVVSGPTDTLTVIEQVVKQLDANPADQESVFVYPLKNGQSDNLQVVLNQLINGSSGGSTGSRTSNNGRTSNSTNRVGFGGGNVGSSRGGGGFGGFGSGGFGGGFGGFGGSSSFGGFGSSSSRGGISAAAQSAASDLAGQVTVVSDPDTNSLLIMTAPKNFERLKAILAELDRAVPQVLIKVLVAEVTHDNTTDLGTEFSVLNLRAGGMGQAVGTDPTSTPLAPGLGVNAPPQSGGPGGLVARVNEANLTATFRALQTAGKLDVLSRPYILTSDNQEASIMIGQSVPIPQNSRITDTGQTINSFTYQNVGIILEVTPHINPDGLVTLDVSPTVSSLSGQTVPITQGLGSPIINQRSAMSRVAILDGQTIVIGGLMQDQKTQNVSKIPLLGDIPGLGPLFSHTNTSTTKTELLFFLTPHVASRPNELDPMSKDELKGTKLTPNAVAPGTFQEHMDGMRRGAATHPSAERP